MLTQRLVLDHINCIIRTDPPPATTATKAAHQPVYLRSFRIPVPKPTMAPKVTQALSELGIAHSRLVMPTRDNCAQLELLLEATSSLVETKKVVDKVEYDIKILQARLGMRGSEGAEEGENGMDVDEGGEGDDGRAQSVVSTRSGRSRKHVRRFLFANCAMALSRLYTDPTVYVYLFSRHIRNSIHASGNETTKTGLILQYHNVCMYVCTPCLPVAIWCEMRAMG
jgi:hypothetical protein